ncbi:non-specific serine/threonine protein kinase [Ranunculus cassubicifolius]
MVNFIAHRVGAATEIYGESEEDELNDIDEVNPEIARTCVGDYIRKSSRDRTTFAKKIFKSLGSWAKVKRKEKYDFRSMEKFLSEMARENPLKFSPKQLKSFTRKFSIHLGSGGFGDVFRGKVPNGMQVAVKVLKNERWKEEQFKAEVGILSKTSHRNLVKLYGYCFDANMVALVFEYVANGSLDKILYRNHRTIEWEKLYNIAIETAKGISYLHDECANRIIHYDIKAANILLDEAFSPKISDFGISVLYDNDVPNTKIIGPRGTPGYAAPEIWSQGRVTHKCDVYSFGIMLFEIVGGRIILNDMSETQGRLNYFPKQVWEKFQKGELEELLNAHNIEEKDREEAKKICTVALWCINFNSKYRPSMRTVVGILKGEVEILEPPNPFPDGFLSDTDSNKSTTFDSYSTGVDNLSSISESKGKWLTTIMGIQSQRVVVYILSQLSKNMRWKWLPLSLFLSFLFLVHFWVFGCF